MQNIKEIKEILSNTSIENLPAFIAEYKADDRAGVQNLVKKAGKILNAHKAEVERTYNLQFFERKYSDYSYICGIDEVNILQATYEAMRKAVASLDYQPDILLNDAVNIPCVDVKQVSIIKGDAKSISIGAASIIAKVARDAMMVEYDKMYPEYDFASNKGYGSAKHIEALKKYGPCPIHRKTFIQHFI